MVVIAFDFGKIGFDGLFEADIAQFQFVLAQQDRTLEEIGDHHRAESGR